MRNQPTAHTTIPHLTCLALALAHLALGCSDDCRVLEPCDVRERLCQREIARVATCLRGTETPDVPVRIVDPETLVDASATESESARDLRRALSLFGLEPAELDPVQAQRDLLATIGAWYSHEDREISIFARGGSWSDGGMATLLVHEYVHAMQHAEHEDAYFDEHSSTWERSLAFSALREGDAVLYQDLALLHGLERDPDDVPWQSVFERYQREVVPLARSDERKYAMAGRRFVYPFGGNYVNQAWRAGGTDAVMALYDNPPPSTSAVISANPSALDAVEDPDEVGLPTLGTDFELVAVRHFGLWLLDALAPELGLEQSPDRVQDRELLGSVFSAWRNTATGSVVGAWRMRFTTNAVADRFVTSATQRSDMTLWAAQRDVILIASEDERLLRLFDPQLAWTPAPSSDWLDLGEDAHRPLPCITFAPAW